MSGRFVRLEDASSREHSTDSTFPVVSPLMSAFLGLLHHTVARVAATLVVLIALLPVFAPAASAQLTSLDGISSKRYIVIDADTGAPVSRGKVMIWIITPMICPM